MAEREWSWYAGRDNEAYHVGPLPTRQEAIDEAISSEIFTEIDPDPGGGHPEWRIKMEVVEATKTLVTDITLDADRILEDLADSNHETLDPDGDGNLFDLGPGDVKDLEGRLNAAFHEWARDKKFNNWAFRETRNEETLYLPHPQNPPRE